MRLPRIQTSSTSAPPRVLHTAPKLLLVALAFVGIAIGGVVLRSAFVDGGEVGASEELELLRAEVSPLLVYSEFGQWADTVWAATVLPRSASRSDSAELWSLDVGTTKAKKLADNVDLLTDPVWTPAGDAVAVRRPAGVETSDLVLVDLAGTESTLTQDIAAPYPIAFAPDGQSLFVATLSADGTTLVEVPRDGGPAASLTKLSDGFSRDWSVSPDGTQVAYLTQTSGTSLSFAAEVYDVSGSAKQGAVAGLTGSQFNPVWRPDGGLTVGSAPATEAAGTMVHVAAAGTGGTAGLLVSPDSGFDVPLSWSTDGMYLVVRNFEGASASDPGPSHVVIISNTGQRLQLSAQSDVLVIGWLD
jgi:Tol biopolymer transport system component